MLKKLIAMLQNLKKETKPTAHANYEKRYGSYTAGYRRKAL